MGKQRVSPHEGEPSGVQPVASLPSCRFSSGDDDSIGNFEPATDDAPPQVYDLSRLQDVSPDNLYPADKKSKPAVKVQRQMTSRIMRSASVTAKKFEKRVSCTAHTMAQASVKRDNVQRALEAQHEELVGRLRIRAVSSGRFAGSGSKAETAAAPPAPGERE